MFVTENPDRKEKKMLLDLQKVIFIKNEVLLLCVTLRERARVFAATI